MSLSMLATIALLAAPAPTAPAATEVLQQIDQIVSKRFYSADQLTRVGWPSLVEKARAKLAQPRAEQDAIFEELIAGLKTSHTEYLSRARPEYWDIASIFESFLKNARRRCAPGEFPPVPVRRDSIGVLWKRLEGRWFVGGVLDGGPGSKAGLHLGDEIVEAEGKAFSPVPSLEGRAGKRVRLTVRRTRNAPAREIAVTPVRVSPQSEFRDAIGASARIIPTAGGRIGYVRIWSWAGGGMETALRQAINELDRKEIHAFLPGGRGGPG